MKRLEGLLRILAALFVLAALGSVSLAKTTPEPALQELLGRQAV